MCIGCDGRLAIKRIFLVQISFQHERAQSLHVLFQEISVKKMFNYHKAIYIFVEGFTFSKPFGYVCFNHIFSLFFFFLLFFPPVCIYTVSACTHFNIYCTITEYVSAAGVVFGI